jgi:hypothetical protein
MQAPLSWSDRFQCLLSIARRFKQKYEIGGIMMRDVTRAFRYSLPTRSKNKQTGDDTEQRKTET